MGFVPASGADEVPGRGGIADSTNQLELVDPGEALTAERGGADGVAVDLLALGLAAVAPYTEANREAIRWIAGGSVRAPRMTSRQTSTFAGDGMHGNAPPRSFLAVG